MCHFRSDGRNGGLTVCRRQREARCSDYQMIPSTDVYVGTQNGASVARRRLLLRNLILVIVTLKIFPQLGLDDAGLPGYYTFYLSNSFKVTPAND